MVKKVIEFEDRDYALSELRPDEVALLRRTIAIAREAKEGGNHPFGCLLADAEGHVLLEQGNNEVTARDCTGHAETQLMRRATAIYTPEEMEKLTLYSCCESCCMCTGAMYWGHLGRLVYAGSEAALKTITGDDPRNPTLDLPCRAVIACGQREMSILGPFPELMEEYLDLHRGYWQPSNQ